MTTKAEAYAALGAELRALDAHSARLCQQMKGVGTMNDKVAETTRILGPL
jgi:hypothetical protein